MEKEAGKPLARCSDLLAGTSIGGIIALGLAAEIPAADIQQAFEEQGTSIFSDRPARTTTIGAALDFVGAFRKPKYRSDGLRKVVSGLIGEETRIGDLKHRVIVPTVNLTKGRPQVFKTPHHETFRTDLHLKAVDVALATSAAPTYFPLAEVGDSLFADGGLYANSPDMLAVHEAEHFLGQSRADVHVLSIGTTTTEFSFAHAQGRNLGIFQWVRNQRLPQVILSAQQHSVKYMMGHQLGHRYIRLDEAQSKEQERHLALDVATNTAQKTIRGLASATAQRGIDDRVSAFLAHSAPSPHFYHKV